MNFIEIFIIAIGLSMDAFAVSICKGLSTKKVTIKNMLTAGLYFGGFQAGMPLLGYFLGKQFESLVAKYDHWVAFILLGAIGLNMIKEALSDKEENINSSFSFKTMVTLAIATSIDALAVGITFAFLKVNIFKAVILIGITTFVFSFVGIKIGNIFGEKYKSKAELIGGIALIIIGCKILIEHLFFQ